MARRRILFGAVALLCAASLPVASATSSAKPVRWSPQPAKYTVGSDLNLPVRAADGTMLRADVYYPETKSGRRASGSFPVLLQQTPYGKEAIASASGLGAGTDANYMVERGYIVVLSDIRGTGTSGGTFGLFDPVQKSDGATMVRWAAKLPHSDGKVGLFGASYMGIDQFMTVAGLGPNSPVKAMFPIISGHDLFHDTVTQGGLLDAEFSAFYLALLAGLHAGNPVLEPTVESLLKQSPAPLLSQLPSLLQTEIAHNEQLTGFDRTIVTQMVTGGHDSFDGPFWAIRSPATYLKKVVDYHIPAFLTGGWNDLFQAGEPLNYASLQNLYFGRPQDAPMVAGQPVTPRYELMMGPWEHVTAGNGVDLSGSIMLEWFDTWLLGQNTPMAHTTTPLHLQEQGTNHWVDTAAWPPPQAQTTAFYLGSGKSGTDPLSTNDGKLTTARPRSVTGSDTELWTGLSSPCSIQSDQWAAGLPTVVWNGLGTKFPCDTNDSTLGAGPGALTYTTAPFPAPRIIAGPIDASIYAKSTSTDTEFVATIEKVSPSGQSVPITSGALLGSFRKLDAAKSWMGTDGKLLMPVHAYSASSVLPVVPGATERYDVDIFPTFTQIPAGWRLRITLTTGDTPHLMPNVPQLLRLIDGVYSVQRNAIAASFVNVPLAPPSAFATPCGALCSPGGP